jgi:hypothetical protein
MPSEIQPFTSLSASVRKTLVAAKEEMSKKYLALASAPLSGVRAFGAFASSAKTAAATNVVGVGVDEKYVDGLATGVHVVKFLVKTKLPKSSLSKAEILPTSVSGVTTDVEEVGLIVPVARPKRAPRAPAVVGAVPNPKGRFRPAQPGSSVGFRDPNNSFVMAGSFGAVVKDAQGNLYVLSNNHVLANESGVTASGESHVGLPAGSSIFQPGLLDGGRDPDDKIAELTRWIDLHADRTDNSVDCAIAKAVSSSIVSRDILFIGAPQGTATATNDMVVHKFGRTTSYTVGRVSSVLFDLTISYAVGPVGFVDQVAIRGLNGKPFSAAGDSGSAILERSTNKVVALLFAGATNGSMTFANHISDVLNQLKVSLAQG